MSFIETMLDYIDRIADGRLSSYKSGGEWGIIMPDGSRKVVMRNGQPVGEPDRNPPEVKVGQYWRSRSYGAVWRVEGLNGVYGDGRKTWWLKVVFPDKDGVYTLDGRCSEDENNLVTHYAQINGLEYAREKAKREANIL